jgi:pyruvate/2-oxoglutarate dehydrogenase complex dihydrolipoamide acyltransferase (E2) component
MVIFPDLVLTSTDRGKKLMGTVEVETSESVNHLEARAQWAHLGRAKAPFHLYVPAGSVEMARRLATENGVNVSEIWSYHTIGDQTRFTLVHRSPTVEPRRQAVEPRRQPAAVSKPAPAPKPRDKRPPPATRRKAAPRSSRSSAASARKSATRTHGQREKRK